MGESPGITNVEFAQFQRLIYGIAGISLGNTKQSLVAGRLGKRLKHYGLATFAEYYRMVSTSDAKDELQTMVDLLTTNETYFFREEKHFEFLANAILAKHPPGRTFDVWSAASSTGEEVYTLAMVMAEKLGLNAPWTVLGSDISQSVLAVAEDGLYALDRTRGLPAWYMRKYCLKGVGEHEGSFLISPELRRHARFMQLNLNAALPSIGQFNVIFLRNVMIYFDAPKKREIVERVSSHLVRGGYLIIGHSESLTGITDCVRAVQPTIYQLQ